MGKLLGIDGFVAVFKSVDGNEWSAPQCLAGSPALARIAAANHFRREPIVRVARVRMYEIDEPYCGDCGFLASAGCRCHCEANEVSLEGGANG